MHIASVGYRVDEWVSTGASGVSRGGAKKGYSPHWLYFLYFLLLIV